MTLPPFIALCGNPTSGKSEVQRILSQRFGVLPVDDGLPLREFAVANLGLTWDQVRTQEGKKEHVTILGREWQVREILGELGKRFEEMLGAHIMPFMAMQRCRTIMAAANGAPPAFSFGSVRRDQGLLYKQAGGVVIGITNPDAPPSPYDFDQFDETIVDAWIRNDSRYLGADRETGLAILERDVCQLIETLSDQTRAA